MSEHEKIDPTRYAGLTPQEAAQAMEEDRLRAINEHPAVVAAREGLAEREREEKAEREREANEARRQRELDARAAWAEEYDRRLQVWIANGGAESDFDAAWPDLKHQILMERVSGDEERKRRAAFSDFRM